MDAAQPRKRSPHLQGRRGFTLVELFVSVAILIIVLGLMVDLANRVRRDSADRLARQLLRQLTNVMDEYVRTNGGELPAVTPFIGPETAPDETSLQLRARRNNADLVRFLQNQLQPAANSNQSTQPGQPPHDLFARLPLSLYDQVTLHDPWGSPIVFMPHQNQLIGMAPNDKYFFFSAGADRQFLTRQDNLYSYEETPMTYEN